MFSIQTNKETQSDMAQNIASDKRVLARQLAHELPVELGNSVKYDSSDPFAQHD
ncbi:MAG: hypothetical protein PHD12_10115 [Methylotenera sp.]|nr:hypothetical protein [Methylotenera sp.]